MKYLQRIGIIIMFPVVLLGVPWLIGYGLVSILRLYIADLDNDNLWPLWWHLGAAFVFLCGFIWNVIRYILTGKFE